MAITGNELMCSVLEVVQEFVLAAMLKTTPLPRDREQSHRRHLGIVRAIRSSDPDAAEKAMQSHMERTLVLLEEMERQQKQSRA
jgi:DNA-binding FadR family transcriptional regulator